MTSTPLLDRLNARKPQPVSEWIRRAEERRLPVKVVRTAA